MNAKEYLSQAWYLDKRIKTKERQLDWLRSHAVYVSPKLAEVPKAPSIRRSPVEEAVVRITELEHEITTSIAQLMRLKVEIAEATRSMRRCWRCATLPFSVGTRWRCNWDTAKTTSSTCTARRWRW